MSRRESRSSLGGRQTSALEEFENFKKKYLLVNKHIAKLNSSLNVRIEELLSQITSLNNDNLRLKASELSLARRLENEQDRTRRLYRETESASQLLVSQINSMKVMFGLDKPPGPSMLRDHNASRQRAIKQPHPPPSCRVARAPEFDMIIEASEEDRTPSKVASSRQSTSPTPASATPLSRRRSTGSTPHSTPASNAPVTPMSSGQGKISDEGRRSSAPMTMEMTNNSSPLTPCTSVSIANQLALVSPSPAPSIRLEQCVTSPISDRGRVVGADAGDDHFSRDIGRSESPSPFNLPQFNATGLKRVSRRPSGFVTEEASNSIPESVIVSIPSTSISNAEPSAYPIPIIPISAEPAPSTPPRQTSKLRLPGSTSPSTPTRTLPMSPKPANPALSPPPGRKLSLTRRQLDFGIVDPEETESEDFGTEINAAEPAADGLLGFQSDSVVGKRAVKRKSFEDDAAQDDNGAQSATAKSRGVRVRRQEKRRDTGNIVMGLTLKERDSREGSLLERGSKESLRDVTNERTSPPLAGSKPLDFKDATAPTNSKVSEAPSTIVTSSGKSHFSRGTVADMAAKLERLSSRPKPMSAFTPVPLPSSDKDVKIPLPSEGQPENEAIEAAEAAAAELGRRNSGRQRKSVNYKEPSLITKMRKPDSNPSSTVPSSAPSSSSTTGSSAGSTPTVTVAPRPPKRKKGSISLVGELTASSATGSNGTTGTEAPANSTAPYLSLASGDGESRRSSKLNLLEPAPGLGDAQIQAQKRASRALWEKYIDISDEEDGNSAGGDNDSSSVPQAEPGGGYFSSETGSRYSFAGLANLRGGSILAKGRNPIIASPAPAPTIRSTASLRIAPGAARERVRDELAGGAGARREREKEREREREREQEADKGNSKGITI